MSNASSACCNALAPDLTNHSPHQYACHDNVPSKKSTREVTPRQVDDPSTFSKQHRPIPSPAKLQLTERETIFATHYVDQAAAPLPEEAARIKGLINRSERKSQAMATSAIAHLVDPLLLPRIFGLPATTQSVDPFDFYDLHNQVHAEEVNGPSLPSSRQSGLLLNRYNHPEALYNQLFALPPISSTTERPGRRPSTLYQPPRANDIVHIESSSEKRFAYRSWREGKPVLGGRIMAGAGESGESAIDEKVTATLPRADQNINARSRKTSHHLGLFKENEAEHEDYNNDRTMEIKQFNQIPGDRQFIRAVKVVSGKNFYCVLLVQMFIL